MKRFVLHIFALMLAVAALAMPANAVEYRVENEQAVRDYLTDVMQLNDAAVAGIMTNIEHESWFDPQAGWVDVNGYTSYGICQWNGSRFDALRNYCAANELDYTTVEGQLAYLQFELEGQESRAYERIKNVPNTVDGAYAAGYNWAKYFERCLQYWNGVDQFDQRGLNAEARYLGMLSDEELVTVYFDSNNGDCLRKSKTVPAGTAIGNLPVPTLEGDEFLGWYTEDMTELTEETLAEDGMTVKAVWRYESEKGARHPRFLDVFAQDYYYDAIDWALENGITEGKSEKLFAPGNPCTRAQVVTFLWRANGSPMPMNDVNPFEDVAEDAYYRDAVLWALEQGITEGSTPNSFAPNAPCTRGQVATFLWRAEGQPDFGDNSVAFYDVNPRSYYYSAVLWAAENGITTGYADGSFGPNNGCTRGHIVTFLYRALG